MSREDRKFAESLTSSFQSSEAFAQFFPTGINILSSPKPGVSSAETEERTFLSVVSSTINTKTSEPMEKFYAMYFLLKASEAIQCESFMTKLAKSDELLRNVLQAAQADMGKTAYFEDRGKFFFGKYADAEGRSIGINFVRLCYEAILQWGEKFGAANFEDDLHIFHFLADTIKKKGKFIQSYNFLQKNYELSCNLATHDFKRSMPPEVKKKEEQDATKLAKSNSNIVTANYDDYSISEDLSEVCIDQEFVGRKPRRQDSQSGSPTVFLSNLRKTFIYPDIKDNKTDDFKEEVRKEVHYMVENKEKEEESQEEEEKILQTTGSMEEDKSIGKSYNIEKKQEKEENVNQEKQQQQQQISNPLRLKLVQSEDRRPILQDKISEIPKRFHADLLEIEKSIIKGSTSLNNSKSPSSFDHTPKSTGTFGNRIQSYLNSPTASLHRVTGSFTTKNNYSNGKSAFAEEFRRVVGEIKTDDQSPKKRKYDPFLKAPRSEVESL